MALGETANRNFLLARDGRLGKLSFRFAPSAKVVYNGDVSRFNRRFIIVVQLLFQLVRSIRPRQALKNLSLLAPLIFSGNLLIPQKLLLSLWAIFIFTILTSSVYLINDLADLEQDKMHPFKKNRPLASGKLPIPIAVFAMIISLVTALYLAYLHSFFFFLSLIAYLALQLIYTFYLKNIIILDVLAIASGFVVRVYAGAFAINVHMEVWFLLCVISLALFLATGKRRAELAMLNEQVAPKYRKTLSFYTPDLLDAYLAMFANSAWLAYALFTFFAPPVPTQHLKLLTFLPMTLAGISKLLMLTVPIVIFGIMRYMMVVYQGSRAEVPERVLLSDKALLGSVSLWGILVVMIICGF